MRVALLTYALQKGEVGMFQVMCISPQLKKIGFDYYAAGGKAFADGRWLPSVQTRHLRRTAPMEKLLAFSML